MVVPPTKILFNGKLPVCQGNHLPTSPAIRHSLSKQPGFENHSSLEFREHADPCKGNQAIIGIIVINNNNLNNQYQYQHQIRINLVQHLLKTLLQKTKHHFANK